jgi:hypothetical protein
MRRTVSAPASCGHAIAEAVTNAEVMTNANKVFFARLFPSTLNHIVIFPYQVRWLKLMQRYATLMPTRARRQMPQGIEKPNGCGPPGHARTLSTIKAHSTTNGRALHD